MDLVDQGLLPASRVRWRKQDGLASSSRSQKNQLSKSAACKVAAAAAAAAAAASAAAGKQRSSFDNLPSSQWGTQHHGEGPTRSFCYGEGPTPAVPSVGRSPKRPKLLQGSVSGGFDGVPRSYPHKANSGASGSVDISDDDTGGL